MSKDMLITLLGQVRVRNINLKNKEQFNSNLSFRGESTDNFAK